GQRWSRVFGAALANAVVAVSKDDVWMGGDGLWRGTAPGPVAVSVPKASEETSLPAATPLVLGPPASGHVVERTRFPLGKGDELAAAHRVSASPDGVLWVQTWNRLVEVVDDKATLLREAHRPEFARWAQPDGKGRGFLL